MKGVPPSNRLHELSADRKGQFSISVNDQWRISFRFENGDAFEVELTDYNWEQCMTVENTRERKIRPTHPGEMLREDYLPDYGLTISSLARAIRVSRQTVNELLRERRAVSPEMAIRLGRLFGNTPEFWLNAQRAVDLWDAARSMKKSVVRIKPLNAA